MSDKEKILKLQKQADDNLAGWQKALADYQNLQKESQQKMAELKNYILADIIHQILPIFDNYYTAITHIPPEQRQEGWAIGLEHILKMWETFLGEHQIDKIPTQEAVFDPNLHEAVSAEAHPDLPDNQIVKELAAGFVYKDQVIRPAKVVVNIINKISEERKNI